LLEEFIEYDVDLDIDHEDFIGKKKLLIQQLLIYKTQLYIVMVAQSYPNRKRIFFLIYPDDNFTRIGIMNSISL